MTGLFNRTNQLDSTMEKKKVAWDQSTPSGKISQVWGFLANALRDINKAMVEANQSFYGEHERLHYLSSIEDAMTKVAECAPTSDDATNSFDPDDLLRMCKTDVRGPLVLAEYHNKIKAFSDNLHTLIGTLEDVKETFHDDVLVLLEANCSKYEKLSISDDEFYKTLKIRVSCIRDILDDFDKISRNIKVGLPISSKFFTDKDFSGEVAGALHCDKFPALRAGPEMILKLECVVNTGQDWLRSDKVYVDHLKREIDEVRDNIRECEQQSCTVTHEYNKAVAMLKQRHSEFTDIDEIIEALWEEIARLETKKTKVEVEIVASSKAVHKCRSRLRELYPADLVTEARHETDDSEVEIHCTNDTAKSPPSESTPCKVNSRLYHNMRGHSAKLDHLQRKKKRLEKMIAQKQNLMTEFEISEADVDSLGKKVKLLGSKKKKLMEELFSSQARLESLETALNRKMHLESHKKRPSVTFARQISCKKKSANFQRQMSRHSKELYKAFRMVKTSIGHHWKDLARVLPYDKHFADVDNDIKSIEHENHGQLQEQAYQSLVSWHAHAGRRASVEVLKEALKELHETRLAEKIETIVDECESE